MERELDALIAERVMDWTDVRDVPYRETHWDHLTFRYSGNRPTGFPPGSTHRLREVPPFSTDIAAAWSVVERARERGTYMLVAPQPGGSYLIFECSEMLHYDQYGTGFLDLCADAIAEAETAPLGICRAALTLLVAARIWP